jgi:endonuclease/exonuclease/phosphatase (EEP) superfamily protein YafD
MKSLRLWCSTTVLVSLILLSTNSWAYFGKSLDVPPYRKILKFYPTFSESELNSQNINILVWNIYKAKKDSFLDDFMELSQGQDILMIQEAATETAYDEAKERLSKYGHFFGVSFINTNNRKNSASGTAVYSLAEPTHYGILRTDANEPFIKTPKVVTYGEYLLQGRSEKLLVVNIHGLNMAKDHEFNSQLVNCFRIIGRHQGPVVFAGDFNSKNKKRYTYMMDLIERNGFSSVEFKEDRRKRSLFSRLFIDHIFIRGLLVLDSSVPDVKGSDHAPMKVNLAVMD